MSKQTLVFNDIEVNKKYFHASKPAIPINLVNTKLNRVGQNNDTYNSFIGYSHDDDVINLFVLFYLK